MNDDVLNEDALNEDALNEDGDSNLPAFGGFDNFNTIIPGLDGLDGFNKDLNSGDSQVDK